MVGLQWVKPRVALDTVVEGMVGRQSLTGGRALLKSNLTAATSTLLIYPSGDVNACEDIFYEIVYY
jgi:hypothetical protein